jgi:hypothetical protein
MMMGQGLQLLGSIYRKGLLDSAMLNRTATVNPLVVAAIAIVLGVSFFADRGQFNVSQSTTAQSSGVAGISSTCTSTELDAKMVDAGTVVTPQAARSLAENSSSYKSAVTGDNSIYIGTGYEWNLDYSNCSVSWYDAVVNYKIVSSNGSSYDLTIGENPLTSTIYSASINPEAYAGISLSHSVSYSGYAVSDNGAEVNYSTAAWYMPTVGEPLDAGVGSNPYCGTSATSSPPWCQAMEWVGLQNSTYDGGTPTANGEVIQTGTEGICESHTGSPPVCNGGPYYHGWSEALTGKANGVITQNSGIQTCDTHFTPSTGDYLVAEVGSQEVINGTSGNKFYTILDDTNGDVGCEFVYPNGSSVTKLAGKEYYSDYFVETPQLSSTPTFATLPTFGSFTFYDCGMITESQGAYTYYNDGYGFGSVMYNGGGANTAVSSMSKNSGTTYGYFSETYDNSVGTG